MVWQGVADGSSKLYVELEISEDPTSDEPVSVCAILVAARDGARVELQRAGLKDIAGAIFRRAGQH